MRIKKLFYALVPMLFLAMGACQEEQVLAPAVNLNEDEISIGAGGGESSVLIKPTRDWTAVVENGADWLTVSPASGSSTDVVVEVKVVAEANEGEARSAKVTFTAANIEEVLTVSQAAVSGGGNEPGDETIISVADFLAKPVDDGVYYRLKGVITDLFNTEYGNFHLVDETGDVLVYGLTAEKQSSNDKSFSTLGLKEGDTVVIEGTRDEFEGEAQVGGPAYYISHEPGQGGGDEPEPGDYTSIADVRKMAPASADDKATIADGVKIKAYVISNVEINNLTSKKNVFVQDETAGLQIRFTSDATFAFGDEVVIDLSGQELSYFEGALQANNVSNGNVEVLSSDNKIDPKEVTVAEFMKNTYDAQYVALPDVQVVESDLGKTFVEGGAHTSINVEDKTGNSFVIFSSKYTTFGNEQVPQGAGVLKGISMINNGKMQIGLTSQDDYAGMTGERFDGQGGDEPDPGEIEEVTIEEFLAKSEGETYYKLTGTVTSIKDDSWGNLTIEDETGNVYVYGVAKDEASVGSGPSFSGLGVEVGDILTIAGKRASYNGSPQVGDAYYISHEKGQGGDEPDPGEIEEVTVEEFLAKPVDAGVYYRLTGTITDLYNTAYGNFHLVDETGDVLVYGLTAEKQSSNDQSFSTLGLKEGDIVTIEGTRAEHNGTAQVGGPAYYISHEPGEAPENPLGDVNVVLGEKAYYEKATVNGEEFPVLKLGTSSVNGDASFTIPAGTTKITMYCVAWKGKSGALNLSGNCTITPSRIGAASNDGASNNSPYTMTVTDADRYEFTVSGCNSDTVINLQSEARVILWDVQLD
ncbi:MAG: BACON domain-containing protein [Bacteroidetes bacterium]|uniref:BACON domain-containing protein n=1 Tax=Candidatus Merdivivens pullistercoris TaxID=2840873 RepID=A0A9D9I4J3_9BACT|nr:BACON domain-containing protein [Candidatus Merdivivens pullistercoris]